MLAALRELNGDDEPVFLQTLIQKFFANTTHAVNGVRHALSIGDIEHLKREGHRLKGTCASFGATRLGTLVSQLQGAAANGDLRTASHAITDIEAQFPVVEKTLTAELNQ